ncbi:MAG: helix-turn-helix domain-containing protein [Myxococcales bacterium]
MLIIIPMSLVMQAARALHLNNRQLAERLGVSKRTVQRWLASGSGPADFHVTRLAVDVWPTNPALARELAAHGGTTVEALGLVPKPPPAKPPTALAARAEHVDAILFAAANALDVSPARARPGVAAALRRMLALGVDAASLAQLLDPQPPPAA